MSQPEVSAECQLEAYDAVHIRDIQQDPERLRILRAKYDAAGGADTTPTACTWCEAGGDLRLFRCQGCKGGMPACQRCLLVAHAERPTCRPEERVNNRWKAITLGALGYVFQQGHEGGECPNPSAPEMRGFYDGRSRQEVLVRACLCNPNRLKIESAAWLAEITRLGRFTAHLRQVRKSQSLGAKANEEGEKKLLETMRKRERAVRKYHESLRVLEEMGF
ncbi:hypothetical protein C8F04DRAFT_1274937 [Mycena alexandri]|uniref:Uncharacterized protein n=1 Tax=Mycena alexandri TaxID=1745969 RepID=A0AAD6S7H5_9AGAR|nr:hypothetical protein C8F04DRAFT_1274937 [Mycena alexandri]